MPPSSTLPGGRKQTSSFGSVDWLSQSSHGGRLHTSRPADVSWGSLSVPTKVSSSWEAPQTVGVEELKSSEVTVPGTSTAGWSKEADSARPARIRTAFTAEQVSTLESSFQRHRYLGPLERRRLAQRMRLSEVQIKTWFQNRRMKHKRQLQDPRPSTPLLGLSTCPWLSTHRPLLWAAACSCWRPWASLPGPSVLAQPPGAFWGPCQVEHASMASAWAPSGRQPLLCCLPDPGSQVNTLSPALSRGPWGLCVLLETGDAF